MLCRSLSCCTCSFACSSIYWFWLPFWYLYICLINMTIVFLCNDFTNRHITMGSVLRKGLCIVLSFRNTRIYFQVSCRISSCSYWSKVWRYQRGNQDVLASTIFKWKLFVTPNLLFTKRYLHLYHTDDYRGRKSSVWGRRLHWTSFWLFDCS